jgi:MFS family permease
MLTVMMITLGLFVRRESRDGALVPVRLFKVAAFSSNMVAGLAYWILMMFPSFLLPFYLRTELHLPVGLIGLSLMPQALAMIVVSPYGGRWMDRVGILLPARSGMAILGVADVATALWPGIIPLWGVWVLLGLQGIAAGIFSSPNSAAILGSVEKRDTGLASSLLATQRNLGRALGVALASALLTLVWTFHGLGPPPSHHSTLYPMWFRWGFRGAFWVGAGFAIVGVITTRRPDVMRRGSH